MQHFGPLNSLLKVWHVSFSVCCNVIGWHVINNNIVLKVASESMLAFSILMKRHAHGQPISNLVKTKARLAYILALIQPLLCYIVSIEKKNHSDSSVSKRTPRALEMVQT